MNLFNREEHSHRRLNILTGDWVQVSPHRDKRPWQGQQESTDEELKPAYDPSCYLCPGNTRANGAVNEQYKDVFAFDNDYGALQYDVPEHRVTEGLLQYTSERGICRVICFSPDHSMSVPLMTNAMICRVIEQWISECRALGSKKHIEHIQIFENKGSTMGCSNPHPHCQIWAQESIPLESSKKQAYQYRYFVQHKSSLLGDYLETELSLKERIVFENEHFVALVPFWAVWPYETMLVPKRVMSHITDMTQAEIGSFADAYRRITIRYDNLFNISFPYSAGIHQATYDDIPHDEWHWHMVFYPPLLRSATVKKFMVGYELLGNPQRDMTPEKSAGILRNASEVHYLSKPQDTHA